MFLHYPWLLDFIILYVLWYIYYLRNFDCFVVIDFDLSMIIGFGLSMIINFDDFVIFFSFSDFPLYVIYLQIVNYIMGMCQGSKKKEISEE